MSEWQEQADRLLNALAGAEQKEKEASCHVSHANSWLLQARSEASIAKRAWDDWLKMDLIRRQKEDE